MTLVSIKECSVSLRSGHGNVQKHVLFEKLTAAVVMNFKRCHLKTIDNCHVITIHIQYTICVASLQKGPHVAKIKKLRFFLILIEQVMTIKIC